MLEQSRRHAFIASLLRIPHLVVCVNKMDLVDCDQEVFERIAADFTGWAAKLDIQDVTFIPISALHGDNVVDRSENMPWYQGPSLLYHLEHVHVASDRNLLDARFPVQWVIRPMSDEQHDYRGYAGEVASGVFRKGDEVVVLPSGRTSRIAGIDTFDGELDEAYPPLSVTLRLEDDIDVSRGDMICRPTTSRRRRKDIDAMVCWMSERPLSPAGRYRIKHTTRTALAKVDEVHLPHRRQHAAPRRGRDRARAERDRQAAAAALGAAARGRVPAQPRHRQLHPHRRVDERHRRCGHGPLDTAPTRLPPVDFALVAFGLGVGILVGMTGIGGGSLMTPMLILVFGVTPITAIGTDLAYAAVTKTVGGYKHWKQRTVDLELSTWMAVGSVPAAVFGVYVLTLLEDWLGSDFEDMVIALLAGALLLTGTATLVRALLKRMQARERDTIEMERRHKIAAVALGVSVGFVLGVTSAGSGALIAVGLILLFRLSPQRVVGTDVFHAAILLWAAGLSHVVAGNVDFGLAGTILLGSVPGRLAREPLVGAGGSGGAPRDARRGADRRRAGAADQGRARHPDRRDRAVPAGGDRPAGRDDGPVAEGARRGRRMMVVMTPEATPAQIEAVVERLQAGGVHAKVMPGELTTAIGAIGDPEGVREMGLEGLPGVDRVIPISRPYKLASSELSHHEPTTSSTSTAAASARRDLLPDRRPVHGRVARSDARRGARGGRGRRLDAPRRRLQAAHLAVRLPGTRHRGARDPARGARGDRPADRERDDLRRTWPTQFAASRSTSSRSAPATCRTTACSRWSASSTSRCC